MFYLGTIGFLQMTILPGLLVLKASRYKGGIIQSMALCFSLSLFFNYVIASGLAWVGLYSTWAVRIVVLLELVILIWLYRSLLNIKLGKWVRSIWEKVLGEVKSRIIDIKGDTDRDVIIKFLLFIALLIAFALAANSILWALRVYRFNFGKVFETWDAILSWNRWAMVWASGMMPGDTGYYPQLLPANWSVIYMIQNDPTIHLFAKSVMPLFIVLILLLVFDLGWNAKSIGILCGVVIVQYMAKKFLGDILADGYVDVPVAFLSFFSVYLLLRRNGEQDFRSQRLTLWFSAIAALAGALTKQAGVFVFLLWPLLVLAVHPRLKDSQSSKGIKNIFLPYFAGIAFLLTFYLYQYIRIQNGLDSSNVTYLTRDIYGGISIWERVTRAIQALDIYKYVFLFAFLSIFFQKPIYRWLTILVVVPFSLIWVFLFSYDTRNLSLAFPFVGLVCGTGIDQLVNGMVKLTARFTIERIRVVVFAVIAVAVLAGLGFVFTDQMIFDRQIELQKQVLFPSLNEKMYEYLENNTLQGKIITDYPLDRFPYFDGSQTSFWFDDTQIFLGEQALETNAYILIPDNASAEIEQIVERKIANGDYELIFEDNGAFRYRFIKIIRRTQ